MSEHTKGHWYWAEDDDEYGEPDIATHLIKGGEQDFVLATVLNDGPPALANARRIVACVNACWGLTTEYLEGVVARGESLADAYVTTRHYETAQARNEALEARLAEAREALVAAEVILSVAPNISSNKGGAAPGTTTRGALQKARAWLENEE